MLENRPTEYGEAAFHYGKHLGIAFQLVDDLLDFEGTLTSLGKPSLNDLKQVRGTRRARRTSMVTLLLCPSW